MGAYFVVMMMAMLLCLGCFGCGRAANPKQGDYEESSLLQRRLQS